MPDDSYMQYLDHLHGGKFRSIMLPTEPSSCECAEQASSALAAASTRTVRCGVVAYALQQLNSPKGTALQALMHAATGCGLPAHAG